jgi:KaiC/GvpD/RAD55 family RecA-like ATPase
MNKLPFSDIFVELLVQIHRAIGYCHKKYSNGEELKETDTYLQSLFRPFEKKYSISGLNKHLTKGLNKSIQERQYIYPRLSKLVIYHYQLTQNLKSKSNYKAEIMPSPLHILYLALTVPEEPQTGSYAFVLCRSMLFSFLDLHPKHPLLKELSPNLDPVKEEDILKSISSYLNYIQINLRWPDPRSKYTSFSTRVHYLNGHILSLKGITHLWFNNDRQLLDFCQISKADNNLKALKKLYSNSKETNSKYSFRLSGKYIELPDTSEIINWIFGIPIPVRGADILFHGGLKRSSNSGLVMSLHGQPGVGKTSTALSLAAVLSPFQTKTIYISLEEEAEDLKTRLYTLIPDYLRWLSIYDNNYFNLKSKKDDVNSDWFSAFKIKDNLSLEMLTDVLKMLKADLDKKGKSNINTSTSALKIPAICPLLIVIDNVNELFSDYRLNSEKYNQLESFIVQCRNMGAIVILIAADDISGHFKLDFLVDVAIHLKQQGLNSRNEKPVRILELVKTRHQISRQGSHVYHLSNSEGFRISPQVPSQMDKREKMRIELPSEIKFIRTLDLESDRIGYKISPFLAIAQNSQILIHGYGSSGKAGFGMKILLTPDLQIDIQEAEGRNEKRRRKFLVTDGRKKILVISFLYPADYYEGLHERLIKQFSNNFTNYNERNSKVIVKAFYPGYLTQEDFFYKIVRLLDGALLEGEPFTGVLLDGLHNIFLQFKSLQDAHMVWPLLYSLLTRYQLTVVSTFTNFSLNERHTNQKEKEGGANFQTPGDFMLMQEGQKPFLHGLVKAADYYFLLEEVIDDENDFKKDYWIIVKSSIRQIPPQYGLRWDRERLTIIGKIDAKRIYG